MWHARFISRNAGPEIDQFSKELIESTSQNMIYAFTGALVATYMGVVLTRPLLNSPELFLLVICLGAVTFLEHLAHKKWPLPSALVWLICLVALTAEAVELLRQPAYGMVYMLLPFMAVIMIGWPAGILIECLEIALFGWLAAQSAIQPLSSLQTLAILFTSILGGIVGWMGTMVFLTVSRWTLFYSDEAQSALQEARTKQVELLQVQEDLINANQELKRLSNRYKALQQEAEEAQRVKAEFVANVSHELRAPLNMIIGFSELITQSPRIYSSKLPAALLADINTIRSNSLHLSRLIDDVLDLSQIEAGRMAITKEKSSVYEIVESATSAVTKLYEAKSLYLNTELPTDLPLINCDRTRIRQILINLLSNAGRFTETGGVVIRVSVDERYMLFCVVDTGPGIAPDDQDKLFQPFQQVDNTMRRQHGGSGLGLSICKRFVEMHDGKIWLESMLNEGTTISFQLPLESTLQPAVVSNARRWINPYFQVEGRTRHFKAPDIPIVPRFVILESGSTLQHLFGRYMGGVEITQVKTADEAINELNRSPAQALIVNSHTNPTEAEEKSLEDLPYETPSITCWVPGLDEAANELGVVHYLLKPVTAQQLRSRLMDLGTGIKTILVAEDDPDLMKLYVRVLSADEPKYNVLRAVNGQEALDLLQSQKPDLMILDLGLPEKDGFQVLHEKKNNPLIQDIPVMVVSSRDPMNEAVLTNRILVRRKNGLSARDLIALIQVVSEILTYSPAPDGQARPETYPG